MIDPADRIALVKLDLSFTDWVGWVLPGGGIQPGEDHRTALVRELTEETGVPQVYMGPPIAERTHLGSSIAQEYDGQQETIYLVPCHEFELAPAFSPEELRAEGVVEVRWWTVDEIEASDESIKPDDLADLARQVLATGAPAQPIVLTEG